MSPTLEWLAAILKIIKLIANQEYQRKAWLEHDPNYYPSIFEELMCLLYDSTSFDEFIENHKNSNEFSDEQFELLNLFNKKIDEFYYKPEIYYLCSPPQIDERKVLADPDWHEIRSIASKVLEAFSGVQFDG